MDFDKYQNSLPYPSIEDVRRRLMSEFDDVPMTTMQRREKESEIESGAFAAYSEQVESYRAEDDRLRFQFFADAHEELGISYLPKPVLDKLDEVAIDEYEYDWQDFLSQIWERLRSLAELATLAYGVGMAKEEYNQRKGVY